MSPGEVERRIRAALDLARHAEEEVGREIIAEIRRHAANLHAPRVRRWWLEHPVDESLRDQPWVYNGPTLDIGAGPEVGYVVWTGEHESYVAAGGTNCEPARYEVDEWADEDLPPGAEQPIDTVVKIIERFIHDAGRLDIVDWRRYDPRDRKLTYKGQAADLNQQSSE